MATKTSTGTVRAAAYTRISSDDQRDELGVKRQQEMCEALIEAKGWTLARTYCDNDRSASKPVTKRPDFDALMADLSAGALDRLVVVKQDRLVRKPDELELVMRSMRAAGIESLDTVKDGAIDLTTTAGRTMARVMGVFDINYAEVISEKVRDKKRHMAISGEPSGGGSRPYGYDVSGRVLVDHEADVIRESVGRVLAGETLHAIAADLNKREIPTVRGSLWNANTLKGSLTSARIAGLRSHLGEVVGEAVWPGIIDPPTRDLLLAELARRSRPKPSTQRKLLTGLLVCGGTHRDTGEPCGLTMYSGNNNGKPGYACVNRPEHRGCGRMAITAGVPWSPGLDLTRPDVGVGAVIVAQLLDRFDNAKLGRTRKPGTSGDVARLEFLEDRIARLYAKFATDEHFSEDALDLAKAEVDREAQEIRQRLGAVERDQARADLLKPFADSPGRLRQLWPDMTLAERREVMGAVIDYITVYPAVRGRRIFDPERAVPTWTDID